MWSIHYKHRGAVGYRSVRTFELAIDEACKLLDQGADISEVASSGGNKTIGADEIRLMRANRSRPNQK
jgi:hypothetical protein